MDLDRLRQLVIDTGSFKYSPDRPFTLASGKKSSVYFDMRLLCADPEGLTLAAAVLHKMVQETGARAVGGLEAGAIPIVTAVSLISHTQDEFGQALKSFYVRKAPKEHGTRRGIEGVAVSPVAILDDVITTGGSALKAVRATKEAALDCAGIFCILFRGTEQDKVAIEREGSLHWIFTQDDFVGSTQR